MSKLRRVRSAITGLFVSTNEADAHPDTTVRETYERDDPGILISGTLGSGHTYGSDVASIELSAAAEMVLESRSGTPPLLDGVPLEGFESVASEALDRLQAAVEAY